MSACRDNCTSRTDCTILHAPIVFYRSLVNENSDTWVVKQLGEEFMSEFRRLRKEEELGWTQIMNRQMRNLWGKGVRE